MQHQGQRGRSVAPVGASPAGFTVKTHTRGEWPAGPAAPGLPRSLNAPVPLARLVRRPRTLRYRFAVRRRRTASLAGGRWEATANALPGGRTSAGGSPVRPRPTGRPAAARSPLWGCWERPSAPGLRGGVRARVLRAAFLSAPLSGCGLAAHSAALAPYGADPSLRCVAARHWRPRSPCRIVFFGRPLLAPLRDSVGRARRCAARSSSCSSWVQGAPFVRRCSSSTRLRPPLSFMLSRLPGAAGRPASQGKETRGFSLPPSPTHPPIFLSSNRQASCVPPVLPPAGSCLALVVAMQSPFCHRVVPRDACLSSSPRRGPCAFGEGRVARRAGAD